MKTISLLIISTFLLCSCEIIDEAVDAGNELYEDGKQSVENIQAEYQEIKEGYEEVMSDIKEVQETVDGYIESYEELKDKLQ